MMQKSAGQYSHVVFTSRLKLEHIFCIRYGILQEDE